MRVRHFDFVHKVIDSGLDVIVEAERERRNPSSPSKTCAGQKLLWSRVTLCLSNFEESDPTTAQDSGSCAVVGSDSTTLDEQGGQIVVQVDSLRAVPGAGFRHFSPLADLG